MGPRLQSMRLRLPPTPLRLQLQPMRLQLQPTLLQLRLRFMKHRLPLRLRPTLPLRQLLSTKRRLLLLNPSTRPRHLSLCMPLLLPNPSTLLQPLNPLTPLLLPSLSTLLRLLSLFMLLRLLSLFMLLQLRLQLPPTPPLHQQLQCQFPPTRLPPRLPTNRFLQVTAAAKPSVDGQFISAGHFILQLRKSLMTSFPHLFYLTFVENVYLRTRVDVSFPSSLILFSTSQLEGSFFSFREFLSFRMSLCLDGCVTGSFDPMSPYRETASNTKFYVL